MHPATGDCCLLWGRQRVPHMQSTLGVVGMQRCSAVVARASACAAAAAAEHEYHCSASCRILCAGKLVLSDGAFELARLDQLQSICLIIFAPPQLVAVCCCCVDCCARDIFRIVAPCYVRVQRYSLSESARCHRQL
jgi:hypothetical protein